MGSKSNLLIYLEKKNIKKPDFYRITGISNGFLDKNNGISSGIIEIIMDKFRDMSIEWLVTGKGEMLRNNLIDYSIFDNNNVQNNVQSEKHSPIDARQYYSDSPEVLRAMIDGLEVRIKEKDAQIKEKDVQINKLLGILEKIRKI